MKSVKYAFIALCFCSSAMAQSLPTSEQFEALEAPKAQTLTNLLADKAFKLQFANGDVSRYEFKSNGYFYFNARNGNGSGKWHTEDGRVCAIRGGSTTCSEGRIIGNAMYFKSARGEIVQYIAE